jgi:hypothetical protein
VKDSFSVPTAQEAQVCLPILLYWCPQQTQQMWMITHSFAHPLHLPENFRIPNTTSTRRTAITPGPQTVTSSWWISTGWMLFAQKKQVTDCTSSFAHLFSMVAIVHLTLAKCALPALLNKPATW